MAMRSRVLGAHLGEDEDAAPERSSGLPEPIEDPRAGHRVRVGDVRPAGDLVNAAAVLQMNRIANVGKLAVLKDDEIVFVGEARKLGRQRRSKVIHNVNVRLQ